MIKFFRGCAPSLHATVRLAETAALVGDVALEADTGVWYGAVLRADQSTIRVGAGSNIQDNAVLHCAAGFPLTVGRDVTVGHGAILHGCTVEDGCMVGMGAILLNGCVIGAGSIVAAGALVTEGAVIPAGSMVMGAPAKVKRTLRPAETLGIASSAAEYRHLAEEQLPLTGDARKGLPL